MILWKMCLVLPMAIKMRRNVREKRTGKWKVNQKISKTSNLWLKIGVFTLEFFENENEWGSKPQYSTQSTCIYHV